MTQLKRELGRLVVDTTAKVTGKILTPDDQRRLQEEAAALAPPRSKTSTMQIKKEVRQLAREMLRASFTDGGSIGTDRIAGRIHFGKKPRNYLKILEYYKRLLRLEIEKRHARIETATALEPQIASQISLNLARRYGHRFNHASLPSTRRCSAECAFASGATFGTAVCATASSASAKTLNYLTNYHEQYS